MNYLLTPARHGETLVTQCDDWRGLNLARALGGRYAQGPGGFYLTPAALAKWVVLADAGYDARKANRLRLAPPAWVFFLPTDPGRLLNLSEAMTAAKPSAVEV